MSCIQTGRREHCTPVFGPLREGGFILLFSINIDFDGSEPIDPTKFSLLMGTQSTRRTDIIKRLRSCVSGDPRRVLQVLLRLYAGTTTAKRGNSEYSQQGIHPYD